MNDAYNANAVPTLGMVEDLAMMVVASIKEWTLNNVDKTELVQNIKSILDDANRATIGTTAAQKAQALLHSVNAIASALRSAGAVVGDDTPFAQFATLVRQISANGYEVCILGKSGTHYTAGEWQLYIDQHGTEPENGAVVAVITPFQAFVIGLPPTAGDTYETQQWGNSTDNVPGLYERQTGSFIDVLQNALNFHSLENTWRMLLWYDPEVLPHCEYDPSDPDKNYGAYGCVRFTNKAQLEASGLHLAYDQQVYIVTTDESDNNAANNCYYWAGNQYTKRFTVPRIANNITGSPAAKKAWNYKAWTGDTRQWTLPTINHLLMMHVYYTEINTCISTLNRSTLPTGGAWSCQQNNAGSATYVAILSAGVNTSSKSNAYAVVPVAAL